jgi:hypothetical protein
MIQAYLEGGLLLAISLAAFRGLAPLASRATQAHRLRFALTLVVASLALPLAQLAGPKTEPLFEAPLKIWSAPSMRGFSSAPLVSVQEPLRIGRRLEARGLPLSGALTRGLLLALALGIACSLARLAFALGSLRGRLFELPVVRRIGRVRIACSESCRVPYSAWLPFAGAWVVVPQALLLEAAELRLAIRHELQHHRQGDTRLAFGLELARALYFWNPAAHAWSSELARLQELACDEALVVDRHVSPRAYGSALLRAAETLRLRPGERLPRVCSGMANGMDGAFLKRRIEMILAKKSGSRRFPKFAAFLALMLLAGSALAARAAVQDRRVTLEEARALVSPSADGFPIVVDEKVLAQLNRFVGTADGREYVRLAIARMAEFRPTLDAKLAEYRMPAELLAVPIIESRYANLEPVATPNGFRAAGLWMFIEQTARRYGLRVDSHVDERLDVAKETDAAMRYLGDNHKLFGDWGLAIVAYNIGERKLGRIMHDTGVTDSWELARIGEIDDYLAEVEACVIILKHPELLK